MRRAAPLPEPLRGRSFTTSEALLAGLSRDRLRRADLARPFHGVRSNGSASLLDSLATRLRSNQRFSHTTALALLGAPLPVRFEEALHVSTVNDVSAPRLREPRLAGVVGHSTTRAGTTEVGSFRLSDAPTAFLEAATLLSVDDLVAVADFLVLDPRVVDLTMDRPVIPLSDLRRALRSAKGRGVAAARRAVARAREGVESPMETALRLLLIDAGLPEPLCGFELLDGRRRVGWFDLAWPEFRVIAEYDGDQHRTSTSQYDRDIARFDWAAELDWRVVRVRKRGVLERPDLTVGRVTTALERGGWSRRRNRAK